MQEAGPAYQKQGTAAAADDAESNEAGPSQQVKLPTVYGPRDHDVKITAERIYIPEDAETGEAHRLIVTFKNLDLKGKGKKPVTDENLAPPQDSSDSDDDDDDDHGSAQAPAQASGGASTSGHKKKKGNKGGKKKNKGRKNKGRK